MKIELVKLLNLQVLSNLYLRKPVIDW